MPAAFEDPVAPPPSHYHASVVVLGEAGVLIRGPSGVGKTSLALALIEAGRMGGGFARLVGDDRVALHAAGGRLVARPHPAIAGRIEIRGLGIVPIEHEPACVLHCVVDLLAERAELGPRLPDRRPTVRLLDVNLPWLRFLGSEGAPEIAGKIRAFLCAVRDDGRDIEGKAWGSAQPTLL